MWAQLLFTLYSGGIHLGNFYIFCGSFFSPKLNLLYHGRKKTQNLISGKSNLGHPVWVHCASLGEFEQGRPLIESIKRQFPNQAILLSFFSPSGYEIRKNYAFADEIIYLPSDLTNNANELLEYYQPSMVILVKYEFWWNLIQSVLKCKVPLYLISGVFREKDYFFKPIFEPFKHLLQRFDFIFNQDVASSEILSKHQIIQQICSGDTRIDRVIENAKAALVPEKIKAISNVSTTIIYGSIWISDIEVVKDCLSAFPTFVHIIAPHDISTKNIQNIRKAILCKSVLYSEDDLNEKVIIIDNIGMLSSLYTVADYVYIGGGFQKGIHNILEPTVFRVPVFFGPNHQKFNEALTFKKLGAAFSVESGEQILKHILNFEKNEGQKELVKKLLSQYFEENHGATEKIIRHLYPKINKTIIQ